MKYDPKLFDPKKHYIVRRKGEVFMFDVQIKNWRKKRKVKGALKDSVTRRSVPSAKRKYKNIFE